MNKRGFTLIELVTTCALSCVIIILLINIVVILKNTYTKNNIKTNLLINQGNLSNALNSKINRDNMVDHEACSEGLLCYNFTFVNGEAIKLLVEEKKIKFGNYTYSLKEGSKVSNPSIYDEYLDINTSNDRFMVIKIPIKNKLYPNEDFGINLVYFIKGTT